MTDIDQVHAAITILVPTLLTTMEGFEQAPAIALSGHRDQLTEFISPLHQQLETAFKGFENLSFPEDLKPFRQSLAKSSRQALVACSEILAGEDFRHIIKASIAHCKAQESLYSAVSLLTPICQYFLESRARENPSFVRSLMETRVSDNSGLIHIDNNRDQRGGYSIYVPEYLNTNEPTSIVFALHGGSGHGGNFIWSWLREARSRGFIVVSPTSQENTWSLMGEDHDLAALHTTLDYVRERWSVDKDHVLLTGMSDGGTYSLLAGLNVDSPFTHLASFSGVLHPEISSAGRLEHASNRSIYLVHGTRDWMFPIQLAEEAYRELESAGAKIIFRKVEQWSHSFARREVPALLKWFNPNLLVPD